MHAHRARCGIAVFLATLAFTTLGSIYLRRQIAGISLSTVTFRFAITTFLSYSPALASFLARAILHEGFRDISFRLPREHRTRTMLVAWWWPILCGSLPYGLAWATGMTHFQWTSSGYPYGSWGPETLIGLSIAGINPLTGFLIRLISSLFFTFAVCAQTLGEELGWRGYMLTRLIDAQVPVPVFWNGLVWGLWHIPFILLLTSRPGLPGSQVNSFFFPTLSTIALGYLISYLRLRSGSIWPAVLAHASNNAIFALAFDSFTVANQTWKGELYLLSVAIPVLVLLLSHERWTISPPGSAHQAGVYS